MLTTTTKKMKRKENHNQRLLNNVLLALQYFKFRQEVVVTQLEDKYFKGS